MATFEKLEQVNVLFIVSALKRIFLLLFSDAGIGHAVGVINFDRDVLKHFYANWTFVSQSIYKHIMQTLT